MNTIALNRKIEHPFKWIALFISIIIAFFAWMVIDSRRSQWSGKSDTHLESVLWTSDTNYQTFYGPGTPQSIELARKLKDECLDDNFKVPNVPIFIAVPTTSKRIQENDPAVIYNFNLDMAKRLREAHRSKIQP